jgi:hypothetical protein
MVHFIYDGVHVKTDSHYPPEEDGRVLVVVGDRGYTWLEPGQWSEDPLPGKPDPADVAEVGQFHPRGSICDMDNFREAPKEDPS